jgi:CheY-like chemotaxis protein
MTDGDNDWGVDGRTEEARVLVVDDETAVLDSFELALEGAGHEVVRAKNGGEALVELDDDIDIVLLDRRMPGMSGDEVLAHVREWQPDCRVVMVTAVDPGVDIVDMTFDDYLTKPVDQSDIVETVDQLLLFERYERLLSRYHATTRKYATLKASLPTGEFEGNDTVATLEQRRDQLRSDLEATIGCFTDAEIRNALERAHRDLP